MNIFYYTNFVQQIFILSLWDLEIFVNLIRER